MCAGAIALARIPKVVFGLPDPEHAGTLVAAEVVRGVLEAECRALFRQFFKTIRTGNESKSH